MVRVLRTPNTRLLWQLLKKSTATIACLTFAILALHSSSCCGQFIFQIDDPLNANAEQGSVDEAESSEPLVAPSTDPNQSYLARKSAIERCLSVYFTRQIDANSLRPWSLMHGLLAFGSESRIVTGNKSVSAVDYLCDNGIGDDRKLMMVHDGKLYLPVGRGFQGHAGQLLAMLAQANVPASHPLKVDGQSFTIEDLIEYEKAGCRDGTELTFKLIGLSHYLDTEATWENDLGETWTIDRLIEQELKQPIVGAACGGSHRLMGLSYAVVQRENEDKPLTGPWAAAATFITEFQEYAYSLQNEDGSFSTDFFEGRSDFGDANKRLLTTGHILEWMVFSLPGDEIDDPRLERSVDYLVNLMLAAPDYKLDVGPRGHALRALVLYESKVYGSSDHAQLMPEGIRRVREAVTAKPSTAVMTPTATHNTISNQNRNANRRFHSRRSNRR